MNTLFQRFCRVIIASPVMTAVLALSLSSCVSMAPPYNRPDAALPQHYSYADPVGAPASEGVSDAAGGAHTTWQDFFTEPELQQLINTALNNNHDLRLAMLRVDEAQTSLRVQRSERFPMMDAGGQDARSRVPAKLSATGQAMLARESRIDVGITAWELDLWGRVRSLEDAALERWLATESASHAVKVALIAEVAKAYFGLQALEEQLHIARQSVASRQATHRIFQRRYELGATSKLDLTQVHTLLTQAQSLLVELEAQRDRQFNALRQLLGGDAGFSLTQIGPDKEAPLPQLAPGLPSELLASRPDIIAAEHRLRAANADIGAARAAFFPRIALTSSLGTASTELTSLFEAGSNAWAFLPVVSIPLFDGGRRRASLALSELRRDIAVVDYEKAIENAFREVADALADRHWLTQQLEVARTAREAQTERTRLAQLRYDQGSAAYLEVLDAQRDWLDAAQQLVQVRSALQASRIALYSALGGGSTAN